MRVIAVDAVRVNQYIEKETSCTPYMDIQIASSVF